METNEAPKKIYLSKNLFRWSFHEPQSKTDIEYIRTDAFIEKALTYLHNKFYFNNVFYGIVSTDFNSMEEMYEDFKNFMKRE